MAALRLDQGLLQLTKVVGQQLAAQVSDTAEGATRGDGTGGEGMGGGKLNGGDLGARIEEIDQVIVADADQTVVVHRGHGQVSTGRLVGHVGENTSFRLCVVQVDTAVVGDHSKVQFAFGVESDVGDSGRKRS